MKLYISQPMRGRSKEEIQKERMSIIGHVAEDHLPKGEELIVIDNFFQEGYTSPLMYLGKSIETMAQADTAFFAKGWEEARGCRIENAVALEYGLTVIEDYRKEQQ